MNRTLKTFLGSLAILSVSSGITVSAQGYYDDDIYYDASKAKKEKEAKALERAKAVARSNYRPSQSIADYAAADTYTVNSGSTRDVDEYNRRYPTTVKEQTDSISLDQLTAGADFANTRRIERFSNPDIITGSNDADLQDYYYASAQSSDPTTVVNINVVDPWYYGGAWSPWYTGWYSGWYRPWHYGWYDPWYSPSWSWGWGPSWSWSWGWGPGWGWSPGWGSWHPHPGHGPSWGWGSNWRPSSPGASRPHSQGGVTPTVPGRRPGNSVYGGNRGTNYGSGNATVPGSRTLSPGRRPTSVNSGSGTPATGNYRNNQVGGSRVNRNSGNSQSNGSSWNSGSRNSGSRNNGATWNTGGSRSGGGSYGSGGSYGGGSGGGRSGGGGGRSGRH